MSERWWEARQPEQKVTRSLCGPDKDGKTPGEVGVSKSVERDTFSLQRSDIVGWGRNGILPVLGQEVRWWYVGGGSLTGALHIL